MEMSQPTAPNFRRAALLSLCRSLNGAALRIVQRHPDAESLRDSLTSGSPESLAIVLGNEDLALENMTPFPPRDEGVRPRKAINFWLRRRLLWRWKQLVELSPRPADCWFTLAAINCTQREELCMAVGLDMVAHALHRMDSREATQAIRWLNPLGRDLAHRAIDALPSVRRCPVSSGLAGRWRDVYDRLQPCSGALIPRRMGIALIADLHSRLSAECRRALVPFLGDWMHDSPKIITVSELDGGEAVKLVSRRLQSMEP